MKIYGDSKSGNCYKLKLVCANLGLDYTWVELDILKKETQTSDFLSKNPNGKIPIIELSSGEVLTESNAILNYIADNTALLPSEPLNRAKVLQWQFFEQYSHEPNIAVARFIEKYLGLPEERLSEYKQKQIAGYKALNIMEEHLSKNLFFVNNNYSIADISLYAYTHVSDEGGIDLSSYPHIKHWLKQVEQQPGYCSMYG